MRTFLAAVSMLSILPLGNFRPTEAELRRSLNLFPLAGVLFGAIVFGVGWLMERWFPAPAAAMLMAVFPEVLTKGFHLDGLADTADGFLSGRSRERKLEIMRDSHIGSMGVGAIVALIGLKFSMFLSLPSGMIPVAAALAALCGRSGMIWYIAMSRYARPEGGLGGLWFGRRPTVGMMLAGLIPPALAALWHPDLFWIGFPLPAVAAWGWSRMTSRVIGGATGDTIGAFEELSELLTLTALVLYFQHFVL